MTIETLIKAAPPPDAPFEPFTGPWEPVEDALGVTLPPDYKDFVRLYGNGRFMAFLNISVPRSRKTHSRLVDQVRTFCGAVERNNAPYAFWPAPGGLIPFGATDDGDDLFWLPRGPSADWPVVVWPRGLDEFEVFECDLTDFLAGLALGEVLPKEFPDDLRSCDHLFRPNGSASQRASSATLSFQVAWRFGNYGADGFSLCRLRPEI